MPLSKVVQLSELIESVLRLLEDGETHSLDIISEKCRIPKNHIEVIIDFFKHFDFAELDETGEKVRINETFLRFLNSVKGI